MVVVAKGEHVWYDDGGTGEFDLPVGATVQSADNGQVQIKTVDGEEKWISASDEKSIRPMHPTSASGVEDMIKLGDLHEGGVLHNLLIRYNDPTGCKLYTYTGTILIAVNPYQLLDIYNQEHMEKYKNQKIGELPPHIFAIADNAYYQMRRDRKNQCCVISGESGAGKTETTKLVLQFLAAVSGQHSWIEQQILEANPILEAFGNAKTIRNDNSSRFGKYIEVSFNADGAIEGANIEQYLLEKSRIAHQAENERNYHVFYQLCAGSDKKGEYKITKAEDYDYLTAGGSVNLPSMDDVEEWNRMLSAMKVLLFNQEEIDSIFTCVAAFLHLGNLKFKKTTVDNMAASELVNGEDLDKAAALLMIDRDNTEDALVTQSRVVRGEIVVTRLSDTKAVDVRDAFVKAMYGRVFIFLVEKINSAIYKPDESGANNRNSIGVLDIFGFENFGVNSFEQLCINFCNENLQQFFVQHIFKMEQAEYDKESIDWTKISFTDNQPVLDLISEKPMNLLALVDEEAKFPKGTDESMLQKLHGQHAKNEYYIKPKSGNDPTFGVKHFAGIVFYHSSGFLDKDRDTFSDDLVNVLTECDFPFLLTLFKEDVSSGTETRKKKVTLAGQFKKSLDLLMKQLYKCSPFFVRCIKPNEQKKPNIFDRLLCTRQLRYSGVMDTIRIRRAGYPIRHTFTEFIERYRLLDRACPPPQGGAGDKDAAVGLANKILGSPDSAAWQVGLTKVFLKDMHDESLEKARETVFTSKAVVLQKILRGAFARARFGRMKGAMIVVQKRFRTYLMKQRLQQLQTGFGRLQSTIAMKRLSSDFQKSRQSIQGLQQYVRGFVARKQFRNITATIETVQSAFRMVLAVQRVAVLRREAMAEKERLDAIARGMSASEADALKAEKLAAIQSEEEQKKADAASKRKDIADAEAQADAMRNAVVDDSAMVDEMFGFAFDEEGEKGEGPMGFEDLPEGDGFGFGDEPEEGFVDSRVMPEEGDDISAFQFSKFATTYFQGNQTATYIRRPLKQPLLDHKSEADQAAARSCWITILRFMNDMPEPKSVSSGDGDEQQSVMGRMYKTLGRKFSKKAPSGMSGAAAAGAGGDSGAADPAKKAEIAPEEKKRQSVRKKMASMTLRKKSKMSREMEEAYEAEKRKAAGEELAEDKAKSNAVMPLQNRPTTNLEKLHFIIGHGILRPNLRNEIYCQICKQLSQNPSKSSHARGWILMSLCLGCFAPTDEFVNYLRCFIKEGPPGYAPYCEERLKRTTLNGTRHQPPSWLELQATKSKKPLMLPITFMDGTTKTLLADSATTAAELCVQLAEKIGLEDKFGFSLYIALFDKVSSLGSQGDHVLDAISQCEQYAKEQGAAERSAPWRLFFRKEIFAPWHNPSEDGVGTNLIYQQVVRGIKFGEYRCGKDEELAELASRQYYVEYGPDMDTERLTRLIPSYIPDSALQTRSAEKWAPKIEKCHARAPYTKRTWPPQKVKESVITYAKTEWPLLFSRFYEAQKFSGPSLPKNDLIIAVNWTGVYFVDDQENVLLECTYPEIMQVSSSRSGKSSGQSFTMQTVKGHEYTFTSANGETIRDLVLMFLEGLRSRSKFVVAVMDYDAGENSNFLSFKKGDLICLGQDDGNLVMSQSWSYGRCDRTGQEGDFAGNAVYVLPSLVKPKPEVLTLFNDSSSDEADSILAAAGAALDGEELEEYSLMAFAQKHFRPPPKKTLTRTLSRRSSRSKMLNPWGYSREVMKQPLLLKIAKNEDLSAKAVLIYQSILKYMGDYSSKKSRYSTELTDFIFENALAHESLRDEIYCQLIKQLTDNKTRSSEERGWELMWLATGTIGCGPLVLKEVNAFLRVKMAKQPLAADCQMRINKTTRNGQRKYPPHVVEVQAIQAKTVSIKHKVYFPNETTQQFEVDSNTRAKDFCQAIGERLGLKSVDGFSLFVRIADKVISMPDGDFFFDFVRHLTEWLKKTKSGPSSQMAMYRVVFMKKLWSSTVIGEDVAADCIFHFHQELPKLIRGYHKCTKEEATSIAALLYRVKFGDDKKELPNIPNMLGELVPMDMVKAQGPDEWRKGIAMAYNKNAGKTKKDAKVGVLKIIARWKTFGSAFFEVKQTTVSEYPEQLLIAINKHGINMIDPSNKKILATHPFSKISNWSSGGNYFHMAIGNVQRGAKLLMETTLGYKMDDLLTSYIAAMLQSMNQKKKKRADTARRGR